ncbi:MAG: aminoacyltransferase [Clostridiales bacterium]|nr:aminoacyltransferase [Clostridiales bacterium]MDY3746082.1 peptidoglycan bridge formation glycyltransferase FemA/FemB family protein [Lachnospiraceae bacterium]
MSHQYIFVENVSKAQFRALAEKKNVKSHFLGSYEWGEVSERRGWTPYYVGVLKDGELAATALLLQKKLLLGFSYFYIPRGFTMDYKDLELLKFMTESVHKFCKKHHSIYFKIDPDIKLHTIDIDGQVIEGENNYALSDYLLSLGYTRKPLNYFFENEQPRFTFRIPLDGTLEEIEAKYGRTTKNCIKTAKNSGVEVVRGTEKDIDTFVRLMEMTEKRQDFYSHDKAYYTYFYDILSKSGMVELYLGKINIPKLVDKLTKECAELEAEMERLKDNTGKKAMNKKRDLTERLSPLKEEISRHKGKPQTDLVVSAYMNVKYDDKSWTLYAANDMEYRKFYANYLVYNRQIEDAYNEGRKIFDVFGTIGKPDSKSKLSGLFEFKKKWGGEYTEFIGEFDYIENKPMYFLYKKLIPFYHKMVNKRLRKQVQQYEG